MTHCRMCLNDAAFFVGFVRSLNRVCESCANRMIACRHEEGTQRREYDSDGCGYFIWRCDECGYEEIE